MPNDAVTVALLQESLMSRSPVRQMAARIMLDFARATPDLRISTDQMEALRAEAGPEVAGEVHALMHDLCIPATASSK
jgi:hypothetical protein